MCGRYYRLEDKQALSKYFHAQPIDEGEYAYTPAYNIAPTTLQPVIRQSRETDAREIVPMRWGLVGHNSAGPDPKRSTFNARSESVEKSPLWRSPFQRHRCLVPLSGFYEWKNRNAVPSAFPSKTLPCSPSPGSGTHGRIRPTEPGSKALPCSPPKPTSSWQ